MGAYPELLESLFDELPNVVFFAKDRAGRYVQANRTLVERCGKQHKRELLGRRAEEVFPGPLGAGYAAQDRMVVQTGIAIRDRLELHLYPGRGQGWCLTCKTPRRDDRGGVVGLVGISRDLHRPDERHPEYQPLVRAVEHLRTRFDQPLRIAAVARRAGISMDRFERQARQVFHLTPRQLLAQARLDAASRLLRETDRSVADIAHACGYTDHSAFSRQFRAMVGSTPRAYREATA